MKPNKIILLDENIGNGIAELYFFGNSYGAMLVKDKLLQSGKRGLWYLTVIKDKKTGWKFWNITHDTQIDKKYNRSNLTRREFVKILRNIQGLRRQNNEIMHWNGKTYYWWTNITNEPNTIKQLRNQYSRCVIGDPVISKTYKTVEMARNNGQLGVYVEDPWEANEEFKTYSNQ